jgi:5-methylcytosine-specific restriction endonuclease McrA
VARRRLLAVADRCAWCGQPARLGDPLTADHVIPLLLGGGIEGNLVAAHRSCNSARTASVRRRVA